MALEEANQSFIIDFTSLESITKLSVSLTIWNWSISESGDQSGVVDSNY